MISSNSDSKINLAKISLVSLGLFFIFSACTKSEKAKPNSATSTADLANRGRQIYLTACSACHNSDPKKPGAIGPDVYGSSIDLIRARLMKAEYPPNYKPKRDTHAMAALPHLEKEIEALHAYLNQ